MPGTKQSVFLEADPFKGAKMKHGMSVGCIYWRRWRREREREKQNPKERNSGQNRGEGGSWMN